MVRCVVTVMTGGVQLQMPRIGAAPAGKIDDGDKKVLHFFPTKKDMDECIENTFGRQPTKTTRNDEGTRIDTDPDLSEAILEMGKEKLQFTTYVSGNS
eukprot:gene37401-58502_t